MSGSWHAGIAAFILLATLVLPALADDDLPPIVAEVLEAVRTDDAARLSALARAVEHDPWRVVDDLLAAGHPDAAKAYAAAVGEPYATPLGRYLAHPPEDDRNSRRALRQARAFLEAGKYEEALDALDEVTPPAGTILAYRVPALRTFLNLEIGRPQGVSVHDDAAEAAAKALGRDLFAEYETVVDAYGRIGLHEDPLDTLRMAERQAELSHYPGWGKKSAYCYLDLASACLGCYLPDRARRHLSLARGLFTRSLGRVEDPEVSRLLRLGLAWTDTRLSSAYDLGGESALAFECGERAVRRFRALRSPFGEAEALWVLGDAYGNAGMLASALASYRSASHLLEKEGEEFDELVFELRVNEGSTLQEMGKLDEALPILRRAADQIQSGATGAVPAVTLMSLGEAQLRAGEPDLALATLARALEATRSDSIHEAWCRMLIGDALAIRGTTTDAKRLAEAEQSYRTALQLLPQALEHTLRLYILTGLGETQLARGSAKGALANARMCADLLSDMTGGMADGEAVSARGHEDRLRATSLGVAAARATEDPHLVLEMLERSRAQAFLAALGGRRGMRLQTLEPQARRAVEAADRQLLLAVQRYRRALATGKRRPVREALNGLEAARAAHHGVTISVERKARLRESLVAPDPARLEDLQAALEPGECVVLYGLLERRSVALVVTQDRAWMVDLPERGMIERASGSLSVEDPEAVRSEVMKALKRLGDMLLGPLDLPEDVSHLLVSPDGGLAHVPWSWLADLHLGRSVDVTLVPSATSLLVLSGDRVEGRARVALGHPDYGHRSRDAARRLYLGTHPPLPLPESEDEAKAAAGPDGEVLLGSRATEAGLQAAIAEHGPLEVLHLACHGIVNRSRPEHSALALSPDEQDDGFLTARDLRVRDPRGTRGPVRL